MLGSGSNAVHGPLAMTDQAERSFWYWFAQSVLWGAALVFAAVVLFHPWMVAWIDIPNPSQDDRVYYLSTVLKQCCVSARREQGQMVSLGRSDIAAVGASACTRESHCARSGRRSCRDVHVTFYCTYDLKDQAGNAAKAIVKAYQNDFYEPDLERPWVKDPQRPWRQQRHLPTNLDLKEAAAKLCDLGYGCG
jgi:hypothetical protein